MTEEAPRAFTVRQVADALQVPTKQVYALIHAGQLAVLPVGRHFRIPAHELDALLQSARRHVA